MAAENSFDLVVIGSGPGGYVGAIRAAQLGKSPPSGRHLFELGLYSHQGSAGIGKNLRQTNAP